MVTVTSEVGALKVSWEAVSTAVRFTVQWKSGDEQYSETERQARVTGTSHTIPGLKADPDNPVMVQVTAWDENGDYRMSSEVPGTPAPGKVTGVTVTPGVGGNAMSLMVSWDEVPGATAYRVQWKSGTEKYSETSGTRNTLVDDDPLPTSNDIANLVAGTEYTVQVTATNDGGDVDDAGDGGDGPASDEAMGTPKPGKVGGEVGTDVTVTSEVGALKVEWTEVLGASSYKVQWKSGAERYDVSRQATATGEEHTITLRAGTLYTVRVIATNPGGDGEASDEATGTPKPGQVMGVRVRAAATPQQLTVSWNPVTGATEGYKVQWKSGPEDYNTGDRQVTSTGTSHTITGLQGIPHTVQVTATNAGGDGKASAEAMGTPKPAQVVTLTPTVGREQLGLNWDDVDGATGYTVQWKSGDQLYGASAKPLRPIRKW